MKITKLFTGLLAASLLMCAGCTTPTTDPDFARAKSDGHQVPAHVAADDVDTMS